MNTTVSGVNGVGSSRCSSHHIHRAETIGPHACRACVACSGDTHSARDRREPPPGSREVVCAARGSRALTAPNRPKWPFEAARRRRPLSTPEAARDDPRRWEYLRGLLRALTERLGRLRRPCECGVKNGVKSQHHSRLIPLCSHHLHRVVLIDPGALLARRVLPVDTRNAWVCREPPLWSRTAVR